MFVTNTAKEVLEQAAFWTHAECPFQMRLHEADPSLLVIAGPNASGKSLFFQFMAAWSKDDALPVTISIRERTGSGLYESASMRRAFMFGNEGEQSTGACSVKVTLTGFKNVIDRKAVLMLDEPDMGLSEDYAHAFGRLIAQEHEKARAAGGENYRGLVMVTHSRSLVTGLLEEGAKPSFLAAGMESSLAQWLEQRPHRSLEELLALDQVSLARWRTTNRLFKT